MPYMSLSGVDFADETSGPQRAGKVKEENERKMFMMTLVSVPWTLVDGSLISSPRGWVNHQLSQKNHIEKRALLDPRNGPSALYEDSI